MYIRSRQIVDSEIHELKYTAQIGTNTIVSADNTSSIRSCNRHVLTCEVGFVLFLAVLENSVLSLGCDK